MKNRIAESFRRNPDWDPRRRAKALGVDVATVRAFAPAVAGQEPKPAKGKSLADFRRTYDKDFIVPQKIKTALAQLGAGGWETELNFARSAGVSMSDIGLFREQFQDHVVLVERGSKRIWAGSKALAAKLREMV
jgi:hypothetical protein